MPEEINGYKAKGALQTAGIFGGLLIATVIASTFLIDRVIGPNLIAKADEKFEERIGRHNNIMHDRGINVDLTEVKQDIKDIKVQLRSVVTKDDLDRFLRQLNRAFRGDS